MTSTCYRLKPLTPEGERLCETIGALGTLLSNAASQSDRTATFSAESLAALGEAGVLAACAPVVNGGAGLASLHDLAILCSRIAEHDASLAIGLAMHFGLSWYFLRTQLGDLKSPDVIATREWLELLGHGNMIVSSAVAEAGLAPSGSKTLARREGNSWSINGEKVAVSLSPAATHFYTRVCAETDAGLWQGTFMIPREANGVLVLDDWNGIGLRGSGSGRVRFVDVKLPLEAFFPRGLWGTRASDDAGRAANSILIVAVYAGIAEAAFTIARNALLERGGATSLSSTASRAGYAELELQMLSMRAVLKDTLIYLDHEITHVAPRSHALDKASALLAHCVATGILVERITIQVTQIAMQLYGSKSYSSENTLGRLYRDVRAAGFMRPYVPIDGWMDFLVNTMLNMPVEKS